MGGILDFLRNLLRPPKPPQPRPDKREVSASVTGGAMGTLQIEDTGESFKAQANDHGRLTFVIPFTRSGGGRLSLKLEGYHDWSSDISLDPELLPAPIQMRPLMAELNGQGPYAV